MNPHRMRNTGSPEHIQSVKNILQERNVKNRNRILQMQSQLQKMAVRPVPNILDVKFYKPNVESAYGKTISMSPSKFLQVSSGDAGNKVQRSITDAHSNAGHSGTPFKVEEKDYKNYDKDKNEYTLLDQMKTDNNVNIRGDELGGVEYYKREIRKGEPIGTPDFSIASDTKRIIGHEGRHRARALKEEGIKKMPVNLVAYSGARANALGIGNKNRTRTKLQGIKPQDESGSGEKDTRAPIFGRYSKLQARLQKMAVNYAGNSYGPDHDAVTAFLNKENYQSYKGKGKKKTIKFESKNGELRLYDHLISRHHKKGIEVSNAGHDTPLTYSTLALLGVDTKDVDGVRLINGKPIDVHSGDFNLIPHSNLRKPEIINKKTTQKTKGRTTAEQSVFRESVEKREAVEQGREGKLPLSKTNIQPDDQRAINKITGVKSPIGKPILGVDAHHPFPYAQNKKLKQDTAGIMLPKDYHKFITNYEKRSPAKNLEKLKALHSKLKLARLRAFTNSSSFVGNMRYDQDEQTITGILSGKHYKWCDVPERKFDSFQGAGSAGAFFNRELKGQHDCGSGGILSSLKSRISKFKLAEQNKEVMDKPQTAVNYSADSIIDSFIKSKLNIEGISGVYDPIESNIVDAMIPAGAIRLQNIYKAGNKKLGFNSITDTRKGRETNIENVRTQLKEIEQGGGIPALGLDDGSLEAVNVKYADNDEEILAELLDHQNSTGILDPDTRFRIVKNISYRL